MADYTIKNLRKVEDAAPKFGLSGIEARFAREALECEKSGLSFQRLEPNVRVPFGHTHAEQEELYVIVGGSGRVKLDDDVVDVKQWDAVRVAGETMRAFEAGPEGLELIAFGAPRAGANAPSDAEMTPGWWTD
jgi:mannose-6-phosphate isomerase-like protein (cupin superfamily)